MAKLIQLSLLLLGAVYAANGQSVTTASGSSAPPGPYAPGQLIFEDNFEKFNLDVWSHEQTLGGGGNWEFEWYTNSRQNSFVRDGTLFIKPTLVSEELGEDFLSSGTASLWGGAPADTCTNPAWYGCERTGNPGSLLNPIKSARIRTLYSFNYKYGKLEIRAKLPTGDWLWPALWLLPKVNQYSGWPNSGEIDLMESRGNRDYTDGSGEQIGAKRVGQTLHWGPAWNVNRYDLTTVATINDAGFDADFHLYQLEWTTDSITFKVDDQVRATFAPPAGGFWEWGQLDSSGFPNPWVSGTKMAPFDEEFHIVINNAVGGIAYFPDDGNNANGPKPWSNTQGSASTDFWNGRNQWLPGWQLKENDNAALQVDYVRVWAL